jgi:hypothetical protein
MFASLVSIRPGPLSAASVGKHSKLSLVERDLEALLDRLRRRRYPETIPVLASYWLKTVHANGYQLRRWRELNGLLSGLLKRALGEQLPNDLSRQAVIEIQAWIQQTVLTGQTPRSVTPRLEPVRSGLNSERLATYVGRLLNEWLPAEVARLLVNESESTIPQNGGIPVLAIGRALERLLVRECLSPATLEMLLQPELLSPQCVYPADAEILGDVVLSLLGRTSAPTPSVMPAALLCVAPGSPLPADYREAVRHAFMVLRPEGEEVHVPIAPAQALEILKGDQVRIGSIIVTMDGRWWESENLQSGEQHSVVYRPMGRLRIDYSADHAKLRVPWPEARLRWSGGVSFRDTFAIFGREWQVSRWEEDAERTWLHLVFSRALPMAGMASAEAPEFRRSRPASVDMAWAALENALTSSIVQKTCEPIERLRHSDLIPLGRAIFGLTESVMSRRLQERETIETQLRAIHYLEAQVSLVYGLVPWRILPAPVRANFLRGRSYPALLELLNQVFDSLPEALSEATRQSHSLHSTSPPHAA